MISAAAANLRMAASPLVSLPLPSSRPLAKVGEPLANIPAPTVAAPATVSPFLMNERRLIELFQPFTKSFIRVLHSEYPNLTIPCNCHLDVKNSSHFLHFQGGRLAE